MEPHRFRDAGSAVIVGGRSTDLLTQLAEEGLSTVEIDVTDPGSVSRAPVDVLRACPDLDTVVTMAGTGTPEDLRDPAHVPTAETTIAVNFLGTILVIDQSSSAKVAVTGIQKRPSAGNCAYSLSTS